MVLGGTQLRNAMHDKVMTKVKWCRGDCLATLQHLVAWSMQTWTPVLCYTCALEVHIRLQLLSGV